MRRSTARALVTVSILPVAAFGSEDKLEEVVVTASFTGITSSKAAPVHILTGEDVTTAGVQSLGEHIDSLLGISTADFGAAVGHPIIRGAPVAMGRGLVHFLEDASQCTARDELHGEVQPSIQQAPELVDRNNAGMGELGGGLGLLDESGHHLGPRHHPASDDLHGHEAVQFSVANATYLAHGSGSQEPEVLVALASISHRYGQGAWSMGVGGGLGYTVGVRVRGQRRQHMEVSFADAVLIGEFTGPVVHSVSPQTL